MLGKGVINSIKKLEGVGKSMTTRAATMRKINGQVGPSGTGGAILGEMTNQGKALNQAGRAVSAMGRNPGKTLAGGALGGAMVMGGMARPTPGNIRGSSLADQLRQNTSYNTSMRSPRSSGAGGFSPRSMGGYA